MRRASKLFYESGAWSETWWLGTQTLKNPLDLWIYQEILAREKPELIVETGTYSRRQRALPRLDLRLARTAARSCPTRHPRPVSDEYPSPHPRG